MFDSITLKFTENDDISIPCKGITVFVGPNNSGKSLILKEIEQVVNVHPFPSGLMILKDYEVQWPKESEVMANVEKSKKFKTENLPDGHVILGRINPNGGREATQVHLPSIIHQINNKNDKNWIATQYLKWGLIRLDGRSRFNLTNDQTAGDQLSPPNNVLAHLFQDDSARKKARDFIFDAFGFYLVVDPTNLGQFRIRLSQAKPPKDEQSLNQAAREFHRAATYIRDASDGVQAFTGIVTAVLSGEFHTILIDEPEAFLHPPLARKLGRNLASLAQERKGALLASTHSSDFLMGCIQASSDVRVVRLEYGAGKSRGRMIDPTALEKMFRKPLMRSANVISGLFYDGVVVTESDNDRAFYSEVYQILAEDDSDLPSILFINAQNKQTIRDILGPLRQFGVPAAAIPDIDIVKDGGKTWTDWLSAAQIPDALHAGFGMQRSAILAEFQNSGKNMKTEGGIAILDKSNQAAANGLFDIIQGYGIFVVRQGELETWLSSLKVPGKKTDWTVAMLERLGATPKVKPTSSDVWNFMREIVTWIKNPARLGT